MDAADIGLSFVNPLELDHPLARLYYSGFSTGGVAIGDVDADGLPDVYLVSGPGPNRLFRQIKPWVFEDITEAAGVSGGSAWGAGAAMADIDNDGDLDIFVCNYESPCQLFINQGRGRFVEGAAAAGLAVMDACLMPAFADYDLDGDLDLFIVQNRISSPSGRPYEMPVEMVSGRPVVKAGYDKLYGLRRLSDGRYTLDNIGRPDLLFRNNGDGTFSDVSAAAGIRGSGQGLSAVWWDYNGDMLPDIYVANDFDDPDHLYHNNGDGTFRDVIGNLLNYTSWFSMGSDVGDVDGDGQLDLFVADMSPREHATRVLTMGAMNAKKLSAVAGPPQQTMRNTLFINAGQGRFVEAAGVAGVADTDWTWAVKLGDLDNDGRLDLFAANGVVRSYNDADFEWKNEMLIGRTEWEISLPLPPRPEANIVMRHRGDLRFADVASEWGLDHVGMSYGAAFGDLDRDGDLDLIVVNLDDEVHLYRNDTADGRGLLLRLQGQASNDYGFGARVTISSAECTQVRMLWPQAGFLSSNDPLVHFGVGKADRVAEVTVEWPSGRRQTERDLPTGQLVTIVEPEGAESDVPPPTKHDPRPLLITWPSFPEVVHVESTFDEFLRWPLLPRGLARSGPSLAAGDVNADGSDDLFVGGAAGCPAQLLLSQPDGTLAPIEVAALVTDRDGEDMGAVWLDADGDGDLDLYVARGSSEFPGGDSRLGDRLYLNDGTGDLKRAPAAALPERNEFSSVVCAADFDRDGDLDLFVGTRATPGAYPRSGGSRLLINDGGSFHDAPAETSGPLADVGRVTSATWSDIDQDGWLDLMAATDWGPVRVFRNAQGRIVESTVEAGLADIKGWFQSIAGRDLDGDGDIDFVALNFGLNTTYRASVEEPLLLYAGDLQGVGGYELLEARIDRGRTVPLRRLAALRSALPLLELDFPLTRDYAEASLEQLAPAEQLAACERYECNCLASLVLWNDGRGRFTVQELPWQVQAAPGFSLLITELDGDGHADLVVGQNFDEARPSAGSMNGALGVVLLGRPGGQWQALSAAQSGLAVRDCAKAMSLCHVGDGTETRFALACNQRAVAGYQTQRSGEVETPWASRGQRLSVSLQGLPGNPQAYGARVSVLPDRGPLQMAEVTAGSGYLSQSTAVLNFGLPSDAMSATLRVGWPDGAESTHELERVGWIRLTHPGVDQPSVSP